MTAPLFLPWGRVDRYIYIGIAGQGRKYFIHKYVKFPVFHTLLWRFFVALHVDFPAVKVILYQLNIIHLKKVGGKSKIWRK